MCTSCAGETDAALGPSLLVWGLLWSGPTLGGVCPPDCLIPVLQDCLRPLETLEVTRAVNVSAPRTQIQSKRSMQIVISDSGSSGF